MERAVTGYRLISAPVRGGELVAGEWRPRDARATVLAVHGITATHRAWSLFADRLDDARVIAPDLRGRGGSRGLPGPWGLRQHADDLARLLDATGEDAVTVVGHSMGAFVAVQFAHEHPDRVSSLVLVDGGLPLPVVPLTEGEDAATRLLGPAAERLRMTFPDRAAYRDFWRAHPAFARDWSPVVEQYVDYDLVGVTPELRASSVLEAVASDALELNGDAGYLEALRSLDYRIPLLRAPRGLLDQPAALYPPEAVQHWQRELPGLEVHEVADVNHYTILMTPRGVSALTSVVGDVLDSPTARRRSPA